MARESAAINPSSVPVGGNVLRPAVSRTEGRRAVFEEVGNKIRRTELKSFVG